MSILNDLTSPADIRQLSYEQLSDLCAELRGFLIKSVSQTGGHLASNLGVVELTVAIHRVFDTARDRLVFDVGHQCYTHKALTGRMSRFSTLRKLGGLSGFPKPAESRHDAFVAGHASTSISAALGIARARTLTRHDFSVIAVTGDGALTGGLAFEALSDAGESGEPMIVILNDNGMSITDNVGGIAKYLSRQRLKSSYSAFKKRYRRFMEIIPGGQRIYRFTHGIKSAVKEAILHCSMFEEIGLQYIGPVDGHNIGRLIEALEWAKRLREPVLVHVITRKGKGYVYSEQMPDKYHGVRPFDYKAGIMMEQGRKTFSTVFGDAVTALAAEDSRVCAITASMMYGTGLDGFASRFPDRFFDVGIAEGHAATMAAGMASQGMVPVFAVYSSFLQRSYDMLLHDVGLPNLHVVFAVDRAGLVSGDGETHQGVFDISFLATVPGMTVLCPASFAELRDMLRYAVNSVSGPVAIRYPRGGEGTYTDGGVMRSKCLREGADYTIVTYGEAINTALDVADRLEKCGVSAEIVKLGIVAPLDMCGIEASVIKTNRLLVLEECIEHGSVGERIAARLACDGIQPQRMILKNLGAKYVPGGEIDELRQLFGLDVESIARAILEDLGK